MSTILPSDVTDDGGGMTSSALSHRDRLVRFYTEHNPSKIPSIESLLKKYEGDEEALIQKVHLKYDVRDVVSHEAVDDLFENERYSYLTMSFGSTYPGHLLVLDRKRWSRASGSPSSQDMHQVELTLPEGYEWTGPWEIDSSYCNCDREGWTYAFDFSKYDYHLMHFTPSTPPLCLLTLPSYSHSFKSMLLNDESHDTAGMADYVRWIHRVRTARVVRWRLTKAKLRAQLATLPHKTLQSKRDLVQRAIWFPHEKGYIWRASVGGMFVGLKDFWVERLELSFSLTCTTSQVVVIFHGAFCGQFDGVKVKGDKGTRIPNAKWTQVDVEEFRRLPSYEIVVRSAKKILDKYININTARSPIPIAAHLHDDMVENVDKAGKRYFSDAIQDVVSILRTTEVHDFLESPLFMQLIGSWVVLDETYAIRQLIGEVELAYFKHVVPLTKSVRQGQSGAPS
ncbi:hypothetical protein DYB31_004868 [Aphanomyces astaci]|uniref:RGS domain-containing protein n=1 Tax=Aphanomyces astaci TaxID=112090 RepID=A0A397FDZ2_APHAT|nr:hypothetical protein DYB31_004868 [Aphanomyces astaci]